MYPPPGYGSYPPPAAAYPPPGGYYPPPQQPPGSFGQGYSTYPPPGYEPHPPPGYYPPPGGFAPQPPSRGPPPPGYAPHPPPRSRSPRRTGDAAGRRSSADNSGGRQGHLVKQPAVSNAPKQQVTPDSILVSGCTHSTVASIVNGSFNRAAENHGRPTYKKEVKSNGLDVMLYFWDDRDGADFCGWWFGPKVGGDQVWAYHMERRVEAPPQTGWQVPYDGPVEEAMRVMPKPGQKTVAGDAKAKSKTSEPSQPVVMDLTSDAPTSGPAASDKKVDSAGHLRQQAASAEGSQKNVADTARQEAMTQEERKRKLEEDRKKKKAEEARKQHEEAIKKKKEELTPQEKAAKAAADKKQQEELRRHAEEEAKKKEEEAQKKREIEEQRRIEQHAALAIRRAMQKVQLATQDNFESLAKELESTLSQELPNANEQARQKMKDEGEKILDQAKKRIAQQSESRRKDEAKRQEEEKHLKVAKELAYQLVKELMQRIEVAEALGTKAQQGLQTVQALGATSTEKDEINAAAVVVEKAYFDTKAALKLCTDFILSRGPDMQDPTPVVAGAPPSEMKQMLAKLLQRINECTKAAEAAFAACPDLQEIALRKASARSRTNDLHASLAKYDKDQDKMLSRRELLTYAKGEFDLIMPQDMLEHIFRYHCEEEERGVRMENLLYVRIAIGIDKEGRRDKQRKADRLAYEAVLKELQASLLERIQSFSKTVISTDREIVRVERLVQPLRTLARTLSPVEIEARADVIEQALRDARTHMSDAEESMSRLSLGMQQRFEKDLQAYLDFQAKGTFMQLGRLGLRLVRACNLTKKFREEAAKKVAAEQDRVRKSVLKVVHFNQSLNRWTLAELLEQFGTSSDGFVSESGWVSFFEKVDKMVRPIELDPLLDEDPDDVSLEHEEELAAGELSAAQGAAATQSGQQSTEEVDFGAEEAVEQSTLDDELPDFADDANPAAEDAAEKAAAPERPPEAAPVQAAAASKPVEPAKPAPPEPEDLEATGPLPLPAAERIELQPRALRQIFLSLHEDAKAGGSIPKEAVVRTCQRYMKVMHEVNMTRRMKVKSQTVRRLEAGEVVEVIRGPGVIPTLGVMRVFARAIRDYAQGWISLAGKSNIVFLEDGGMQLRVVRPLELGSACEVEHSVAHGTLAEGELIEVREWPRLESTSGRARMQVQVKSTGAIGWVTTCEADNTSYVELV